MSDREAMKLALGGCNLTSQSQLAIWAAEVGVRDKTMRIWQHLALRATETERERIRKIIQERYVQSHARDGGGFVRAELDELEWLITEQS